MSNNVDNFLSHYGVLGMKWGVRKNRSSKPKTKKTRIDRVNNLTPMQTASINQAKAKAYAAQTEKGRLLAIEEWDKMEQDYSKEAKALESRSTGEKVGLVILAGVASIPAVILGLSNYKG